MSLSQMVLFPFHFCQDETLADLYDALPHLGINFLIFIFLGIIGDAYLWLASPVWDILDSPLWEI